ncbi:hypothetical protein V2G26_006929 [Clonostachys chloroleuca]
MDDCVTMLGQGEDTELDILLATQAKYHAAMGHVADICPEPAAPHEDSLLIPVYLIKSMDLQLQSIRQSVLMHLQTSKYRQDQYCFACLRQKSSLRKRPCEALERQRTRVEPDLKKLEMLQSLLGSIERWFNVFFDLPSTDWLDTIFESFVQYSHFILILLRLTLLREPGWDGNAVRDRISWKR